MHYDTSRGRSVFCAHCGDIRRNAPRGRFCSKVCRQRAYYRRRAALPEDTPHFNMRSARYIAARTRRRSSRIPDASAAGIRGAL
jgi:hypothetical protein